MRLPMFPLGSVLFPGQVLPLHIFEQRYLDMLTHCLAGEREFGVVLIERGSEVGGGDVRSGIGTVARIVDSAQASPGHWAVIAVGDRRICVDRWLPDAPWPCAEVDDLPDTDRGAEIADWPALIARHRRVVALAAEMGRGSSDLADQLGLGQQISTDPGSGSYQLAALSPLGEFDRQKALSVSTVRERVDLLTDALTELEVELRAELDLG